MSKSTIFTLNLGDREYTRVINLAVKDDRHTIQLILSISSDAVYDTVDFKLTSDQCKELAKALIELAAFDE